MHHFGTTAGIIRVNSNANISDAKYPSTNDGVGLLTFGDKDDKGFSAWH